jgi:hypothetical protein
MPLTLTIPRVVNPSTSIAYRITPGPESWRITRSAPIGNVVALVHLRGQEGAGAIDGDLVQRFIAGYGVEEEIVAPGATVFRRVVLADFISTSDRLTAAATRARNAFHGGLPGLRPRSPAMRQRFEAAYAALHDAWKGMAATWGEVFGREDVAGLPDWLVAAWEHKCETWERAAALAVLEGPED